MRGATQKLRKKAPQAARAQARAAETKRQASELRTRQRELSLYDASVLNSQPIIQSRTTPPEPQKSSVPALDDVEGPGLVARIKAFLSFRGFNATGITSAQVLQKPVPARNHKARPVFATSQPTQKAHAPQLKTIVPANFRLKPQKVQAPRLRTIVPARSRLESKKARAAARAHVSRSLHKTERLERARRILFHGPKTSGIAQLRQGLGLNGEGATLEDAVYVSIDTEYRGSAVLELGVSTLDTRDIAGIKPDHRATNWIAKVKHHHFVPTDLTSRDIWRARRAMFCASQPASSASIRTIVLSLLQIARDSDSRCRKVHVVGQSISNDLCILAKSQTIRINFLPGLDADFSFDRTFDTSSFAAEAKHNGVHLPNGQLGSLAQKLGVDSKLWMRDTVLGTHNASNDAAYAMMVMLLFAVRWNELPSVYPVEGAKWEPRMIVNELGQLRIHPVDNRTTRAQERYERANLALKVRMWITWAFWGDRITERIYGREGRIAKRVNEP